MKTHNRNKLQNLQKLQKPHKDPYKIVDIYSPTIKADINDKTK